MAGATLLQLFLFADVFVAGTLSVLALQQLYAHFRAGGSRRHEPAAEALPPILKEKLVEESEANFQAALSKSTDQLEHDLGTTAGLLDKLVKRMGAEIVGDELERYRIELAALRKQAQQDMTTVKEQVAIRQAEMEADIAKELAAEKQRLLQQIDTKLADAVVSFLVEDMQHNIDLGAQEPYLKSLLEAHKAEFRQEVDDEPKAA